MTPGIHGVIINSFTTHNLNVPVPDIVMRYRYVFRHVTWFSSVTGKRLRYFIFVKYEFQNVGAVEMQKVGSNICFATLAGFF